MQEKINTKKELDEAKSEHLEKGFKPIMVCMGPYESYGFMGEVEMRTKFNEKHGHDVDYYEHPTHLERKNFKTGGKNTYTISPIDNRDKFSETFYDCTGLVVTGIDETTGENISFVTHQDPTEFLKSQRDIFKKHLGEQITEISKRCKKGSIDAVIIGGQYPSIKNKTGIKLDSDILAREQYTESIKFLSKEIQEILGFNPVVVNGPKLGSGWDDIYYSNKERRLYLLRPKVNSKSNTFNGPDIDQEKEKWK